METTSERYRRHLETLDGWLADAVERAGRAGVAVEGVVFHAGRQRTYHADDRAIAFWPTPHFRRWVPALEGPEHVVVARPGRRPTVVRVLPRDYWHDSSAPPESYWEAAVELVEAESFSAVSDVVGPGDSLAYVGNSPEAATELGIAAEHVEPAELMDPLDWYRAVKTELEIALLEAAAERATAGHAAARAAFEEGASERDIHAAYLAGAGHLESELPFDSIVALDAKSAILHYQHKRGDDHAPGTVGLVDAGGASQGYAADVTRTWTADGVEPEFRALVEGVDRVERELVAMVTPGRPYVEIQHAAYRKLAELLAEIGVFKGSGAAAVEAGLMGALMPHGVGHLIGIQVHDVGGHQAGPDGGTSPPPPGHPFLRNTRPLEPGHAVTIEPGVYFIDMLLEPLRSSSPGRLVDWELVDRLTPMGGVRIEDDVVCTADGPRDLTRPLLPGPADG